MTYKEAIYNAIDEQMKTGNLVLFGQDIQLWGGRGGVLKSLYEKYPQQVLDTPISEAATAGIAVGLGLSGMKAMVTYDFMDFILHSADQIINQAPKINFMSRGEFAVPVIFNAIINSGIGYGATHSQSLESMFMKVPDLQVVYPSNATDAYKTMQISLASQMPTVFIQHKLLQETSMEYDQDSGLGSRTLSEGKKLTIATYGHAAAMTMEVLDEEKIDDVAVIDLRWLSPLDVSKVMRSVDITKNLLLVEDGYGLVSAEVITQITADNSLSGVKVSRLTTEFSNIPVNEQKESEILLTKEKISARIREVLKDL